MIARHNCFLTRRIDYFRATAPSLANTRKSETLDSDDYLRDAPPRRHYKLRFSPLYGTFSSDFSIGNRPWIVKSIPWKQKSMGCFGRNIPWIGWTAGRTPKNNAGRRTTVGVRFNGLPYSAQGFGRGGRRLRCAFFSLRFRRGTFRTLFLPKTGCGSEMEGKASFSFSFLSPCTIFALWN